MLDLMSGAAVTRVLAAVIAGPVKASALVGLDNIARKQLIAQGFLFDDVRTTGYGVPYAKFQTKAASYTVLASEDGTQFAATAAAAFTLPALAAGLSYTFFNEADTNMSVASAEGTNMIVDGNASASSVTFSTSSHKIGGCVKVVCNEAGTKWRVYNMSGPGNVITIA